MTAVSDGRPPSEAAMPMATGAVTDLGASEASVAPDAPRRAATPTAETAAKAEPTSRLTRIASAERRTRSICR